MTVSAEIGRIMDNARVQLPGALDNALKLELFNVVDEFLQHSNVWQEEVDFDTIAGQTTYEIDPASNALALRLIKLEDENDVPVYGTMYEPGLIELCGKPSQVFTLTVTYSLTVRTKDSDDYPTGLPKWIWRRFNGGILDGLLGRMMSQPAKPYSNERLAIYHMRRFRGAMARARIEATRKNLQSGQAWAFPQSFATGR